MSLAASILSVVIAVLFTALGFAKVAALEPMRERAAHAGFGVPAYRRLGVLEVTGAAGLLIGLAVPQVGLAAALGLVLLLVGALVVHVRAGDGLAEMMPAIVVGTATVACGLLLASEIAS